MSNRCHLAHLYLVYSLKTDKLYVFDFVFNKWEHEKTVLRLTSPQCYSFEERKIARVQLLFKFWQWTIFLRIKKRVMDSQKHVSKSVFLHFSNNLFRWYIHIFDPLTRGVRRCKIKRNHSNVDQKNEKFFCIAMTASN